MKKLTVSRAASGDLREIYAYTFERWGERQADSYLGDLQNAMDGIAAGSALVRPLASRHQDMFKLQQGRHLIIYCEPTPDEVLVVRVLHDRMDIDARLEE